jgi:hypothetical protein
MTFAFDHTTPDGILDRQSERVFLVTLHNRMALVSYLVDTGMFIDS